MGKKIGTGLVLFGLFAVLLCLKGGKLLVRGPIADEWVFLPLVAALPIAGLSLLLWSGRSKVFSFQSKLSGTLLLLSFWGSIATFVFVPENSVAECFGLAFSWWFAFSLVLGGAEGDGDT